MNLQTSQQQTHWDTNLGWWADKIEKSERPSQLADFREPASRRPSVWRDSMLIVAVMFALVLSLISLATR